MILLGIVLSTCQAAFAQTTPPVRPFEVASIRAHKDPVNNIDIRPSGNRLNVSAEWVGGLILWAYHLRNFQVPTTPELAAMNDVPYDIVTKAEGDGTPTKDQFRQMLQLLLADRFKMVAHHEMREMPVYSLVVGKNGPNLKPSSPVAGELGYTHVNGRNYEIAIPKADMERVVDAIMNSFPDRPVIDETGLTGTYDLRLVYTPQTRANRENPDPGDLSIFTAVQEQLGLKLEARKAMVDVLIVDHIEKPAAN